VHKLESWGVQQQQRRWYKTESKANGKECSMPTSKASEPTKKKGLWQNNVAAVVAAASATIECV
jgi:hypothetical protein